MNLCDVAYFSSLLFAYLMLFMCSFWLSEMLLLMLVLHGFFGSFFFISFQDFLQAPEKKDPAVHLSTKRDKNLDQRRCVLAAVFAARCGEVFCLRKCFNDHLMQCTVELFQFFKD